MLSTDECYTAVLLECGPPQYPGTDDDLTRRFMVVQTKEFHSAVTTNYHTDLVLTLNRWSNLMERDDLSAASFLQWYESKQD